MDGFIGVHVGAGNYSESLQKNYKKLCRKACQEATATLLSGGSSLDAATTATMILEASELTNAGYGSNLNIDGNVEVDAGAMDGKRLTFGGVGAVPGMCHPVVVASEICKSQQSGSLTPFGLVAPSLIVGIGATTWAKKAGLSHVLSESLISDRAKKHYQRNKSKLERSVRKSHQELGLQFAESGKEEALDTVGAVAIDSLGHIAATCSSGGISLKHSGRVGQAAVFGAGCWAEDARLPSYTTAYDSNYPKEAVAACTTGCGEYLIHTSLARELAHAVRYCENSATVPLHSAFTEKFLHSPFLEQVNESGRLGGAIVLRAVGPCDHLEFLWAHSTQSMCIGYMITKSDSKPKSRISRLPNGSAAGSKVIVEGISLDVSSMSY